MKVIAAQRVKRAGSGEWWLAVILHTDVLTNFQLTGADVEGMDDDDLLAAGSIICTPTANYIAYEDGTFAQSQIAGSGGGGGGTAGVSSFNGRTGAVTPRSGDYNAQKINTTTAGKSVQDLIDELQQMANIDTALSPTSERAVQNKVVNEAIQRLEAMSLPVGGSAGDLLAKVDSADFNVEWIPQSTFMKKSEYDTDNNGRVDKADTAYSVTGPTNYQATMKNTSGNTYLVTDDEKGKRNGVVPLDSNRKILPEYLPDSITAGLTYGGIFNATTRVVRLTPAAKSILGISADTMTLQNSSQVPEGYPANAELFYITTVADTFAGMNFAVGDWLISLATEWQQLANGSAVSSVNGQTGAVQLNSDDIVQGTVNLYMSVAERNKLQNIETEATKDVNVVQQAQIVNVGGVRTLRLTNKNGVVVDFEGAGGNLDDYLKKDGNNSNTYTIYNTTGSRQAFVGNETLAVFANKVAVWLNALETVAFSGSYLDLSDKPTRTSQFTNDGYNGTDPYITRTTNALANYYLKTQTYTKQEVDDLISAIEGFAFIQVNELPSTNINDHAIYYVPIEGGTGYNRYQHMNGQWLFLGSTDMSMTGYLMEDGDASQTTVGFTSEEKVLPATGEELATIIGKVVTYLSDLKNVAFTASYQDLVDSADLALQTDLDEKVDVHWSTADEGKLLGIDANGDVALVNAPDGAMRKGTGTNSVIGNDTAENPLNVASGSGSVALGLGTIASGNNQVVSGMYNQADNTSNYSEIIGGGSDTLRENIRTLDWGGNAWTKGKVSVGNTTTNIVQITQGNDLTTKNYVDNHVEEAIASANLLKAMVVTVVPDVEDADDNILYLIEDPTHAETYLQYKKVLESQNPDVYVMAQLGSTQISSSSTQVTELPTPSIGYKNAVYQYVGSDSTYEFGMFYTCKQQDYYCWLQTASANKYFTKASTPRQYDKIYTNDGDTLTWWVESVTGNTLTDSGGNTYTRLQSDDKQVYEWQELNDKLSDFVNDGNGTGAPSDRFITLEETENRYKLTKISDASSVTTSTKLSNVNLTNNQVQDVTVAKLWDFMWKKIYPVGAIYISVDSTSPATLFGGTWSQISDGYYLRASSSGGGNTLAEQLPDVTGSFRFSSGSQGHPEVSSPSGAFKTATNGNLTYPWPTDGTSGGPRTVNFALSYFNSDLYKTNGAVQPKSLKVFVWKRTA